MPVGLFSQPPLTRLHTSHCLTCNALHLSFSCSLHLTTPLLLLSQSTVRMLSIHSKKKKKSHSAPLLCLCGLMSYSSSREAGFIKVERDNSLSCSLELPTLVIPWEIFYVLCIKFVSPPTSHAHTHFYSFSYEPLLSPSIFSDCLTHPLLFSYIWANFSFVLFFLLQPFLMNPPYFAFVKLSPCPCFDSFLPFSTNTVLYCTSPPELDTDPPPRPPVGPVSPSIAQLAGLIDLRSSWIPLKVNY